MGGLKARDGFIGEGLKNKKQSPKWKILISAVIVLLIVSSVIFLMFSAAPRVSENKVTSLGYMAVQQDLGSGYKNPQVVSAGDMFIAGTVNYGKLTITFVNATTGNIENTKLAVSDVDSWYFRIAVDSMDKALLIAWNNGSNLNGTFLHWDSGIIEKTDNFTIASDIATTGLGLAYGDGKFLVVWSDSNNHNYGRTVEYNASDPNTPILGAEFKVSSDTHSHADNFVAYDGSTSHFIVLWRNYSGISGLYNITGKIFDSNENALTGDFLIANGVANNTKYDYPSAEGGSGVFFVAYVNYNSPYDVHGVYINATNGTLGNTFNIGTSNKYGVSFVGIAYNGNSFIAVWTNESYDIVAMTYDIKGNALLSQPLVISNTTDSEEWQDVAYNNETNTYYFVWYDYTAKHDYGSLWTSSEIPEFSAFLPILIVAVVAFIAIKRRH